MTDGQSHSQDRVNLCTDKAQCRSVAPNRTVQSCAGATFQNDHFCRYNRFCELSPRLGNRVASTPDNVSQCQARRLGTKPGTLSIADVDTLGAE